MRTHSARSCSSTGLISICFSAQTTSGRPSDDGRLLYWTGSRVYTTGFPLVEQVSRVNVRGDRCGGLRLGRVARHVGNRRRLDATREEMMRRKLFCLMITAVFVLGLCRIDLRAQAPSSAPPASKEIAITFD